jgi:hypothetical protein
MHVEHDPRPDQAAVAAWIAGARLDQWLALRGGFVDQAVQASRFADRLQALVKIRNRKG